MINIYDKKASKSDILNSNGIYTLDDICIYAEIKEVLNGIYELEAEFKFDENNKYKEILEERLLRVDDVYGEQVFRIAKTQKTQTSVRVYARHIFYDTNDLFLEDVRPDTKDGNAALDWILKGTTTQHEFNSISNITNINTAYYKRKTVLDALINADNSFLKRWSGEIDRSIPYTIKINDRVGSNRGVQIRSDKNLLGFEEELDVDTVISRVYPVGAEELTIPEKYIDSSLIDKYSNIKSIEHKFDNIKVITEPEEDEEIVTLEQAQEMLRIETRKLYDELNIDKIKAKYLVDFVDLSETEEYKHFKMLEKVWLGDTISVYVKELDINIEVRVIERIYDVLEKRHKELKLSNYNESHKSDIDKVFDKIDEIITNKDNWIEEAKQNATDLITNGIKNSHVLVRKNEILIMDTPDPNTAVKIWRFNQGGLGYSSTGHNGEYGLAMTMDGSIVADFIKVGTLSANLIKTGSIKNSNNNFEINLDAGSIRIDGNKFKISVNGVDENVATSSQLTQTEEKFEYKFANYRKPNLLSNSNPKGDNTKGWTLEGTGSSFYPYHFGNWAGIKSLNYNDEVFAWSPTVKINNGGKYSVSFFVQKEQNVKSCDVLLVGSIDTNYNYDWHTSLSSKIEDNNFHRVNITVDIPSNIKYLRFRVDNDGIIADSFYVVWFGEFMLIEGEDIFPPVWYPPDNELYNNITSIDNEGIQVKHSNGSKTKMTHEAVEFTANNGNRVLRIKDGGMNFHTQTVPELVGFIKPSILSNPAHNGVALSTYNQGDYISIGHSTSSNENEWTTSPSIMILKNDLFSEYGLYEGVNFLNQPVIFRTRTYLKSVLDIDSSAIMEFYANSAYPHRIFNSASDNSFCFMGDNSLSFGVRYGETNKTGLKLAENGGGSILTHSYSHWDFHNYTMSNMQTATTLSSMTRSMPLTYHHVSSLTNKEIRYVERETQHTVNYTLTVELPQTFAENIELDYHINIGKSSFGDYRIVEKNPYYFTIESDKEDFTFTYEIVAKLVDRFEPRSFTYSETKEVAPTPQNETFMFIEEK